MLQEIKTFRDFIKDDPKEQFAWLPLQIENCLLYKTLEKDEKGISKMVLHVFDHSTNYIGTIEEIHYMPQK